MSRIWGILDYEGHSIEVIGTSLDSIKNYLKQCKDGEKTPIYYVDIEDGEVIKCISYDLYKTPNWKCWKGVHYTKFTWLNRKTGEVDAEAQQKYESKMGPRFYNVWKRGRFYYAYEDGKITKQGFL